jgi:hypothetical protein
VRGSRIGDGERERSIRGSWRGDVRSIFDIAAICVLGS